MPSVVFHGLAWVGSWALMIFVTVAALRGLDGLPTDGYSCTLTACEPAWPLPTLLGVLIGGGLIALAATAGALISRRRAFFTGALAVIAFDVLLLVGAIFVSAWPD